jgi:hypothetical protein
MSQATFSTFCGLERQGQLIFTQDFLGNSTPSSSSLRGNPALAAGLWDLTSNPE